MENRVSASVVLQFLVHLVEKYPVKENQISEVSTWAKKVLSARCVYVIGLSFPAEQKFECRKGIVPRLTCWLCKNKLVVSQSVFTCYMQSDKKTFSRILSFSQLYF